MKTPKQIADILLENQADYNTNIHSIIIKALKNDDVLLQDYQNWFVDAPVKFTPNELYELTTNLKEFERIELHNNGDDTAEVKIYNWDTGEENIVGTLI